MKSSSIGEGREFHLFRNLCHNYSHGLLKLLTNHTSHPGVHGGLESLPHCNGCAVVGGELILCGAEKLNIVQEVAHLFDEVKVGVVCDVSI